MHLISFCTNRLLCFLFLFRRVLCPTHNRFWNRTFCDSVLKVNFGMADIRVGRIVDAWLHADSDTLFCEHIDIGEEAPRPIASGIRAHYQLENLKGRLCLVKTKNSIIFSRTMFYVVIVS